MRVADNTYAKFFDSTIRLASRPTGVSRPELMDSLGISRIIADRLIEKVGLKPAEKVGRTEFFKAPSLPEGAQAAVVVHPTATSASKKGKAKGTPVTVPPTPAQQPEAPKPPVDAVGEEIQGLDRQIVEVRKLLAADFAERAKIDVRIAGHQALLTALLSQHLSS